MAAKEGANILDQVEGGGEEGEVVAALPRQQGGVEQAPHPLRLHLQGLLLLVVHVLEPTSKFADFPRKCCEFYGSLKVKY